MQREDQRGGSRGGRTTGSGGRGGRQLESARTGVRQQQAPQRQEDWVCASCGDLQFARNANCRRCSAPKPTGVQNARQAREQQSPLHSAGPAKQEDWTCVVCDDRQFARNTQCRRCGMGRPTEEAARIHQAKQKKAEERRDWTCIGCGDLQFARNTKCRRCLSAKPTLEAEREWKARKRAQEQAAERERQRAKEEAEAEARRKADEFAHQLRRLTGAGWDEVRLLFIGATDQGSLLSHLPMEMIMYIAKMSTAVPECWATTRLAMFKTAARASPTGTAKLRIKTYDLDPDGFKDWPESMNGYELEYHVKDKKADERITVHRWHESSRGSTLHCTTQVHEHWSEALFLAKASYDPHWHCWLTPYTDISNTYWYREYRG